MHIGEQVKAAREQKGVGMYTLARELGVSPHTMIKLEKEGWTQKPSLLQAIADRLGCELHVVFKSAEDADGLQ